MKIQYCSDLHLEFKENQNFLKKFPIKPEGHILLLAGDIIPFGILDKQSDFFNYIADNFEFTFWIPGNHEYYGFDMANVKTPLYEKIRENIVLLNNHTIIYHNVELVFSTLWSYIPPPVEWDVRRSVNDFNMIKVGGRNLRPAEFNALHTTAFDFLKSTIAIPTNQQRIVVTHHVPTLMNYPAKYKSSNINSAFAVELYDFIENCNAAAWIYGHHHCNIPDFKIGNTLMLTNQLGYVENNEHQSFVNDKVILLGK